MYDSLFVPIIIITVYWIFEIYKVITKSRDKYLRLIPILSAPLGGGLGILLYLIAPSFLPADNVVIAFMIGGASGLAATGTNQIFKQLSKSTLENNKKKK